MLSAAMTALLLVHVACVVLHVATAAAWFGMALRLSADSRDVATADAAVVETLAQSGGRAVKQMGVFLLLTLAFALGAIFTNGGFETYSWTYWWHVHVGLGLMLVLLAIHYIVVVPSWKGLVATARASGPASRASLAAALGAGHLIWFGILVLMFYPRFTAALSVG